jgi:orotate phosphoribosyltransferase
MNIIEKELFRTGALKISGTETPFWYTSGTFGPFYINTHYLFGGEEMAVEALEYIDFNKKDKYDFPAMMTRFLLEFYNSNEKYRNVVDFLVKKISENIDVEEIDYISGGERRDWFFSYIIAYLLQKKHITIYKNMVMIVSQNGSSERMIETPGGKALHISDLITEGSSYFNFWIPALKKAAIQMPWTLTVVDRQQGGTTVLASGGVKVITGTVFGKHLFEEALENNQITKKQFEMVREYMKGPSEFMRRFVMKNPEFLTKSIEKDEKTRERAVAFIKRNEGIDDK